MKRTRKYSAGHLLHVGRHVTPTAKKEGLMLVILFMALMSAYPSRCALAESKQGKLKSTPEDRTSVSVTVYNNNLGLIREIRSLDLPLGNFELMFEGVASKIDPTSVHIRSLNHPEGLTVLEQNFEYDIISTEKLLEKYLGKTLFLVTVRDGKEHRKKATLIGIDKPQVQRHSLYLLREASYVYEIKDKIAIDPPGRILLPALPEGLISKPSLVWTLKNGETSHFAEVSYLATGIVWQVDYTAVLAHDDRSINLSGWVTIDNNSGATYTNASLKLVAGDVNRVQRRIHRWDDEKFSACVLASGAFEEETFFEYHVYDMETGDAFDIVADCIKTEFKVLKKDRVFESTHRISTRNHKNESVVVAVKVAFPGSWKIKETTHEYEKEAAGRIRFDLPVEKKGETVLTYKAIVTR
ncbi:MAG: hypothetical protein GTO51_07860 [Candidatus Latescibacteria bacterium]|nr:hypothetical protein [Candidatus Latescibacterota bacterium]NIM21748.1 hypothetical protein [Candidatus Latescibacterota bacterium]NIM65886.1 hypothetical protein [Candidatus Latescibacterota bacterium]NIO02631.1 hypothetical protein [Candidatus Latescibacterota bacterium]NIO29612.1 hypothetical protein [Candidatus Latescibacterota bacterium]